MRTTVSIDDEVLGMAKRRAADEGRTLGDLITEALRERFARRQGRSHGRFEAVTWGEGAALPGIDVTSNAALRDRMDEA